MELFDYLRIINAMKRTIFFLNLKKKKKFNLLKMNESEAHGHHFFCFFETLPHPFKECMKNKLKTLIKIL